jgi:hypothetical protein
MAWLRRFSEMPWQTQTYIALALGANPSAQRIALQIIRI